MAFDANDLTPHEQIVVERTRFGEIADFAAMGGGGAIRAGFLRRLMLELEPSWPVQAPGVRIKGARIEGALDLTGCTGAGDRGLPALNLEDCDIAERMDLSGARLTRLSLRGSKLSHLLAHAVKIEGPFDFAGVHASGDGGLCWLDLRGARIEGRVYGAGARLCIHDGMPRERSAQNFALILREARIAGGVVLRPDFSATGGVTLFDANVEGMVDMRGAHLRAIGRRALNLGNLRATGVVSLNRGFRCEGPIWMRGAVLEGGFNMDGASVMVAEGEREGIQAQHCEIGEDLQMRSKFSCNALADFSGSVVNGNVRLDDAIFSALPVSLDLSSAAIDGELGGAAALHGQLKLSGARIGRNLDLKGAEIGARATARKDAPERAIDAASISVGGAALFNNANIKGEIFLPDARIEGYLAFGGGRFIHGGGWAIRAPNARVGGNVTLKIEDGAHAPFGVKTVIEGGAKFDRTIVDGALSWLNLELRGPGPQGEKGALLSLADARIAGALQAKQLTSQPDARINVAGACCASLDDDVEHGWGPDGVKLNLPGFAYGRIDSANESWRKRLSWLKRGRGKSQHFSPQPFAHAAQVYARMGRREDARRISLAQHDQQTAASAGSPATWAVSSLFGLIAGYGLAPVRIVRALALYLALGIFGVVAMNAQGALVRPDGSACNGAVDPVLYAVDVALPVLDLGQESQCAPGRTHRAELSDGMPLGDSAWRVFEGGALWKWAHALYAIMGAILSALAVITFSGVMKPKDE